MSDSYGTWDPRVLTPEMKELIDNILYGVATHDNKHAIESIQRVFEDIKNPKVICIDSGIKKVEKKIKGSFGIVDSFIMGMALGSGGKYIRADDVNDYWDSPAPFLVLSLIHIRRCRRRG